MRKTPGDAPCHACLLHLDKSRPPNPRSSWRRICDDCASKYVASPLPVPNERVRICPDTLGVWGQSREIYQSWDTGLGAVVPARKYYLSPVPDGKVAVVLQDAADAETIDRLLAPRSVKLDRPFRLRYCSSIKSFCADECFGSAQDKSCLMHIKQRKRIEPEGASVGKHSKREVESPSHHGLASVGWLLDDVDDPGEEIHEEDCFGAFTLGDIYDLSGSAEAANNGGPEPSCSSTASTTTSRDLTPPVELHVELGEDSIMDNLGTLLGGDSPMGMLSSPMLKGVPWSQSAVDVAFDDVLGAALTTGIPPGPGGCQLLHGNAKIVGKPLLIKGVNAPISKHTTSSSKHMWVKRPPGAAQKMGKTLVPPQQMGKPGLSPSRKAAEPMRHGPTQKAKCVWKQQIMW